MGYMIKLKSNISVNKISPVQLWIDTVSFSHSDSQNTARAYTNSFREFCQFIEISPTQILAEYENSTDRDFKRKYARLLKTWIALLRREGYARNSVIVKAAAVKSFFKYSDLPLGLVAMSKAWVEYTNRDIRKEEIAQILSISNPRERAFFTVMAQSGLRPQTICELRLKHMQPDFAEGKIPCKITVPRELAKGKYRGFFTFIAEEAIEYLKAYLKTRTKLTPESFVFTLHGHEKPMNKTNASNLFRRALLKLKEKGTIEFSQKARGKPSQLRLYNLRKWFRKQAGHAGNDFVNFWMGHTLGVDIHYFSEDSDYHRKQYVEKAMPFLRIEQPTPSETEEVLAKQAKEIEELKKKLAENTGIRQALTGLEAKYVELLKRLERMEKQQS